MRTLVPRANSTSRQRQIPGSLPTAYLLRLFPRRVPPHLAAAVRRTSQCARAFWRTGQIGDDPGRVAQVRAVIVATISALRARGVDPLRRSNIGTVQRAVVTFGFMFS